MSQVGGNFELPRHEYAKVKVHAAQSEPAA
jgi:hypothetical protein